MFTAIITGYRFLYLQLASLVGYGWAIVALSFICSFLMLPLMRAVAGVVRREKEYEDVIDPQVAAIKCAYASDMDRHFHIQALYQRYGYSPLAPIKKVLPLFVQIPFLLLTYYMLKGTAELSGVSFLFLSDLGQPDALISTSTFSLHLLPLVMTGVNILTVFATPGFSHKDWTQAIAISLLFLVLLYTAPSALLLYWTLNNTITFVRTLCEKRFAGAHLLASRIADIPGACIKFLRTLILHLTSADFWQSLTIVATLLSLYLFVTARSLVVLTTMNSHATYLQCQLGMLMVVFAACILSYLLLWRERVTASRLVLSGCAFLLLVLCSSLVLVRYVSQNVFYAVKSYMDRFVIFEVLALFLTIPYFFRKRTAFNGICPGIRAVFKSDGLLLLLPLAMAIHYSFSSVNITLSPASVFLLCLYMVLPCVLLALLSIVAFRVWWSAKTIFRCVVGIFLGIYLIPLISTEHGIFSYDNNLIIRLTTIFVVTPFLVFFENRKTLHVFLCVLIVVVTGNAAHTALTKTTDTLDSPKPELVVDNEYAALNLPPAKRHNNVFFLVYDAFENPIVQRALGIDDPTLSKFLADRGFTLYDAYSTGYHTLSSISAAFTIGGVHGQSQRSTVAGDNPFCDFLHENGYRNSFMLCGYTMPKSGDPLPGDFYYPTPSGMVPQEIVLYTCILRGILSQSPTVFNHYTMEEWASIKHDILKSSPRTGWFLYAHCGLPDHANYDARYRGSNDETVREYLPRLNAARAAMRKDVEMAIARNDDAIIIIASDHGAYLRSPDVVDKPDARDLLDRHGVFLAIRWPKDYVPTLQLNCLQNVALEVLICLTGDSSLARLESEGSTDAMRSPSATPPGVVKRGIIQSGPYAGKSLFEAAQEEFSRKGALKIK